MRSSRWLWMWLLGCTCLVTVDLLSVQRRCISRRGDDNAHHATMSASTDSSATDVEGGSSDAPQVEALFLIKFDKKVGWVGRVPPWRRQG